RRTRRADERVRRARISASGTHERGTRTHDATNRITQAQQEKRKQERKRQSTRTRRADERVRRVHPLAHLRLRDVAPQNQRRHGVRAVATALSGAKKREAGVIERDLKQHFRVMKHGGSRKLAGQGARTADRSRTVSIRISPSYASARGHHTRCTL